MTSDLSQKKAVDFARHSELVNQQNSEAGTSGLIKVSGKTHSTRQQEEEKKMEGKTVEDVHAKVKFPAKERECNKCHKIGHFADKCKTRMT